MGLILFESVSRDRYEEDTGVNVSVIDRVKDLRTYDKVTDENERMTKIPEGMKLRKRCKKI